MIKVLIINQFASTPEYSTGAGERFYYLVNYFQKNKIDSVIVSGSSNHLMVKKPKLKRIFTLENIPGGKFVWLKLTNYKKENFIARVFSWFEFLLKLFFFPIDKSSPPQVVIVSSMSILPSIYALFLKKRFKSKFILEVRDIWPMTPIYLGGYSKYNPLIIFMGIIEKIAYSNADEIVSVLPSFNLHLKKFQKDIGNFTWIPNAIENSKIIQRQKNVQIGDNKFRVIYAGALGIANAMKFVIMAANLLKSHPEIEFNILGDGPEKANLINYSKELGLQNINFLEKVSKSEVSEFLNKSDLCIISWNNSPLYKYGVSANKYNDYMLASKPIISASNIDSDPVLISNCGIQVNPEDPKAIANGILYIQSLTVEERNKLGENGYNFIVNNQTYEIISARYIKLIKGLI